MLDETRFHLIADATLMHCHDQLEDAFERGELDELELENGILTMVTQAGQTFVLNKHAPTQQLWLASPLSGGLHFSYARETQDWQLADGRTLYALLRADLAGCGIKAVL
ncbi:MAG: iron donor protein CyaY [Alphaproteobacteria bacterium]